MCIWSNDVLFGPETDEIVPILKKVRNIYALGGFYQCNLDFLTTEFLKFHLKSLVVLSLILKTIYM